tara:strand:- start:67 stop:330 length:264 start_codon:yes stop_codon:yes gene_type:complete
MYWFFILVFIAVIVGIVSYPLFFTKMISYRLPNLSHERNSEAEFWLSGLSDLEYDFGLGHISKIEYQQQKKIIQRGYLDWQKSKDLV